jgi:hypothetical protein
LRVKDRLNQDAYEILIQSLHSTFVEKSSISNYEEYSQNLYWQLLIIITNNKDWENSDIKKIFGNIEFAKNCTNKFLSVLEMLISDSIFCLDEILRLIKTAGDSYLFNHNFLASIYDRLADWTVRFEALENIKDYYCSESEPTGWHIPEKMKKAIEIFNIDDEYRKTIEAILNTSQIHNYLRRQIGYDFQEKLSSHYYREQALSHYFQMIDLHNSGRAYMNLLEQMYFIKGDYDDITSHYNVALERFLVNNTDNFKKRKKDLKEKGKRSTIYQIDNYFERIDE